VRAAPLPLPMHSSGACREKALGHTAEIGANASPDRSGQGWNRFGAFLGPGAATWGPVDPIWISLARRCFGQRRLWNPSIEGLEKLGFPWILSSETSLINRLHGIPARNFS